MLQLLLGNATSTKFTGPVTVTLYASTDNSLSSDDTAIATITVPKVNLRPGASKRVSLKFIYSTALSDGAYYILGSVSADNGTASVEADALAPVTIAAPTVDLATSFGGNSTVTVSPNHNGVATIVIQNLGNVTAIGTMSVLLYGSAGPTLDFGALMLASMPTHAIAIKAGHSIALRVHFVAPTDPAGTYYMIASTSSNTDPGDANSSNDVALAITVSPL